jgi:alpha,alpha-trehalase
MCWVALDRAIALADRLDALDRVERWKAIREEISDAIMTLGWNEDVGAFTQSFGSAELDASNLMMPIVGFIPAESPRMRATIDATAAHLTDQRGLIYRYRGNDGLEGAEGTFLFCTFLLAHAQALAGELDAARATFEIAAAYTNDVSCPKRSTRAPGTFSATFPRRSATSGS